MSCPRCNLVLDEWTAVEQGTKPSIGDLSVCIECLTILVFDSIDPLAYHILTKEERGRIDTDMLDKIEVTQLIIKKAVYES